MRHPSDLLTRVKKYPVSNFSHFFSFSTHTFFFALSFIETPTLISLYTMSFIMNNAPIVPRVLGTRHCFSGIKLKHGVSIKIEANKAQRGSTKHFFSL